MELYWEQRGVWFRYNGQETTLPYSSCAEQLLHESFILSEWLQFRRCAYLLSLQPCRRRQLCWSELPITSSVIPQGKIPKRAKDIAFEIRARVSVRYGYSMAERSTLCQTGDDKKIQRSSKSLLYGTRLNQDLVKASNEERERVGDNKQRLVAMVWKSTLPSFMALLKPRWWGRQVPSRAWILRPCLHYR